MLAVVFNDWVYIRNEKGPGTDPRLSQGRHWSNPRLQPFYHVVAAHGKFCMRYTMAMDMWNHYMAVASS